MYELVSSQALKEAIARYGKSEIFNTDQGSQFTSGDFTGVLLAAEIRISMDGKGRWIDNRLVERLWRSLTYECVYINAFETGTDAHRGIGTWIGYYNTERPHSALDGRTPGEAYEGLPMQIKQRAVRHKHMHVVRSNLARYDLHLMFHAYLA